MKIKIAFGCGLVLSIFSGVSNGQWQDRELAYPENSGVILGQGWDTIRERPTPTVCLSFDVGDAGYQDSSISVRQIVDYEQLILTTSVEARAKVKSEVAKTGGKAQSSLKIENDRTVTSSETNLLVTGEVRNGVRFVAPDEQSGKIGLSAAALSILNGDSPDVLSEFNEHCGDAFVLRIQDGARADGLFRYRLNDYTTRRKVTYDAGGSGSFLGMGGGGGVKYIAELTKQEQIEATDVTYFQQGGDGTGDTGLPTSKETILTAISELPKVSKPVGEQGEDVDAQKTAGGAKPIRMWVMSYRALPDFPDHLVEPRDPTYEEKLARYYLRLVGAYNDVSSMYRDIPFFNQYDAPKAPNNGSDGFYGRDFYTWDIEINLGLDPSRMSTHRDRLRASIGELAELLREIENKPECYRETKHVDDETNEGKADAAEPYGFAVDGRNVQCLTKNGDPKESRPIDTNAYIEYIDLPVPRNSIHKDVIANIENGKNSTTARLQYAVLRWFYWVLQMDQIRCEAIGDCLTRDEKAFLYYKYLANLGMAADEEAVKACSTRFGQGAETINLASVNNDDDTGEDTADVGDNALSYAVNSILGRPRNSAVSAKTGTRGNDANAELRTAPMGNDADKGAPVTAIYVDKCDAITIGYTNTSWQSRFYVERYPVTKGADNDGNEVITVGEKDKNWRHYTNSGGAYMDVGPRSTDYLYEIHFETSGCGGPWVEFGRGNYVYSNCPSYPHNTDLEGVLSNEGQTLTMTGYMAARNHSAQIVAKTRFIGSIP